MLKASPLKHKERPPEALNAHASLNDSQHATLHQDRVAKYGDDEKEVVEGTLNYWKGDSLFNPTTGMMASFEFDDGLSDDERTKLKHDRGVYDYNLGNREEPNNEFKGQAYNKDTGFITLEDLKKTWKKNKGETDVDFPTWLKQNNYETSEDIARKKKEANINFLKTDIDKEISPETNYAELASWLAGSTESNDNNDWSGLNMRVAYTDEAWGNREEVQIHQPTLIGLKYKDGSPITDEYGNTYINRYDFTKSKWLNSSDAKEAEKLKETHMLELNQILKKRKETHGNLDAVVNGLFINMDDKMIADESYRRRDRGSNTNFDRLLNRGNQEMVPWGRDKKLAGNLKEAQNQLMFLNDDLLKDTGLNVWTKKGEDGKNVLVLNMDEPVENEQTGEFETKKEFKNSAELKSWLGKNLEKEQVNALVKNSLALRRETVEDPVKEHRNEQALKGITNEDLFKQYTKSNGIKPSKVMGMGWNNYDQLIEKEINDVSNKHKLQPLAKKLLLERSTDYLFESIKNNTEPTLEGLSKFGMKIDWRLGEEEGAAMLRDAFNALNEEYVAFNMAKISGSLASGILDKKSQTYIESLRGGPGMSSLINNQYDEILFKTTNKKGEEITRLATHDDIRAESDSSFDIAKDLVDSADLEVGYAVKRAADNGYNYKISEDGSKVEVWWDKDYQGQEDPHPGLKKTILDDIYSTLTASGNARGAVNDEILRLSKLEDDFNLQYMKSKKAEGMLAEGEMRDTDYWSNWQNRFGRGVDNITHGTGALFGNEYSTKILEVNNRAINYEKAYEWDDSTWYESFGMTAADQGANAIYFIGTMGAGTPLLGIRGAMAVASFGVGVQSAGQQRSRLESHIDMVPKLKQSYKLNEAAWDAGYISEQQYLNTKAQISKSIDMGSLTDGQKWSSVLQHGFVEAGFTYAFGRFGSLNTANNVVKVFTRQTSKKALAGQMHYNAWVGIKEVTTGVIKGMGYEAVEETSIYLTTGGFDSVILDIDWDISQLDKVIRDAAVMSGGMNTMSLTYSTVMNHSVRTKLAREYKKEYEAIKALEEQRNKLIGDSPEIQRQRENLNSQIVEKLKQNAHNWQKAHVEALGLSEKDTQSLFENGRVLKYKYLEAGVIEGDSNETIDERLENHKKKLNQKKKGSGDTWLNDIYDLRKTAEGLKEKTDVGAAEISIYGDGSKDGGENVAKNRKKIQDEIKKDKDKFPDYNSQDAIGKLAMELEYIYEKTTNNAIKEMKQDPATKKWVENNVFSEMDEDGNIIQELDQQTWKAKNNRTRISPKQKKLIDAYYKILAPTHITGRGRDLVNFKQGKKSAISQIAEIQQITGKKLEIVESNNVEGLLEKINEAENKEIENGGITQQEAAKLREQVEANRETIVAGSNGFMLGNKWMVVGKDKALENMKNAQVEGGEQNFLQGVVFMHEMSHYLDNLTRSPEQIIDKADRTHRYLNKDKIYKLVSEEAIDKLTRLGIYDKTKSFEDQDFTAKDEYLRKVQELLSSTEHASSYNEVLKKGGSLISKFTGNEKYNIKTDKDAVFEIVANIEAFRNGNLTGATSTRLKNIAKWNNELSDLKNILSPTASDLKQIKNLEEKVKTAASEGGSLQMSGKEEDYINSFIKNKDGKIITKEQYDKKLSTRRKGRVNLADLLTPENNTLNGSIRNLGTLMEGSEVFGFPMDEFMNTVKSQLTQAITTFNPEENSNLSGWLAQHILWKKPGVIDDFAKRRKIIDDAKEPGDEGITIDTPEGTLIVAKIFNAIAQGENVGKAVTKIIEENYDNLNVDKLSSYKDVKKLIKDGDGPLTEILKVVSEKFGIDVGKIINNEDLDIDERRAAQLTIRKLTAESTLGALPEGFNSSGKATGIPPTLLNAVNPETGENNLIYTKTEDRISTVKQRVGDKIIMGTAAGPKVQKKNFVENINKLDYLNLFGITKVGVESRYRSEDKKVDGPIKALVVQLATIVANQTLRIKAEADGNFALASRIKDGKSDLVFSLKTVLKDKNIERSTEFFRRSPDLLRNLRPGFGKSISFNDVFDNMDNLYNDIYNPRQLGEITDELLLLLNKYKFANRNIKLNKIQEEGAWKSFENELVGPLMDNVFKSLGINETAAKIFNDELNINTQRQSVSNFGNHLQSKVNPKTGEIFTINEVAELLYILEKAYAGNSQISYKNNFKEDENGYAQKIPQKERIGKSSSMRYQSYPSVGSYETFGVMPVKGMTESIYEAAKARVNLRQQKAYNALASLGSNQTVNEETANLIKEDSKRAQDALELFYDMLLDPAQNYTAVDQGMFLTSNLSHMAAPIRRAATFSHVAEGMTTPGHKNYVPPGMDTPQNVAKWMKNKGIKGWDKVAKMPATKKMPFRNKYTVVYEHVIPASDMAFRLGHYKNKGTFFDGFWDKYTVSIIPTAMDNRLKAQGLIAMSQPGFIFADPNSDQFGRYYGPLMYGFEEVAPVINIFDGSRKGDGMIQAARVIPRKKLEKINKQKVLNNSVVFSRKVNPPMGMSAWDLDDTLARTKSGVRYTLPNPTGKPQPGRKVIFMAGGPGSGKSTVIKGLNLEEQGFKIVNQDISLEWLMKNHGLPGDMKDFTPEQASKFGSLSWDARMIAKRKQAKYQGKGDGIIVDGTGNSLKVMQDHVQEFKNKGYDVQMVFVETSLETALGRNRARKERSLRDGIVKRTHDSVQKNKESFKELFGDRFAEIKTDKLKQGDPMPISVINKMNSFTKGYIKGRLTAEEFANEGTNILEQGGEFDFAEFDYIKDGKQGPLFNKAMESAKKFGLKDQFILTARPHAAKMAIYRFLDAQGLNIPFDNIITLEDSTPEAKALWIAKKVGEGYNDIYFADDALQNVQAVDNVLKQLDVKGKVQQAKRARVEGEIGKSKKESIKSELGDVNNLGSPNNYNNIQFSKKHRAEYENTIAKYRPDLVKDGLVSETVDNMFIFIDSLNITNDKKRKYERITTKWLATSSVKLVEDRFKITDAINLAEKYKEDVFSYRNPNELIEKYAGKVKEKFVSPNKVKEFSSSGKYKERGITIYNVENTKEGQQAVRDVIDSHWGKNSNPWCITQAKNGKLTEDAWLNWTAYEKGPKRIVFQDGKLSSFYANGQYWGRMDNATDAPVITVKEGRVTKKVELVPIGKGKVEEFVRETRTVSKDKKTVTTEILEESQDGYDAGTKIVENRVNGVTVKSTRYGENGKVSEIIYSDKSGKTTSNITFTTAGKTVAINRYGTPFGDMSVHDIVMEKGDLLSHETSVSDMLEGEIDYFHGKILLDGKVTEIGFQAKVPIDLKNVTKTVDGKVRVDLKKVLEIDPDTKGLPATDIQFSKSMNTEFNDILENVTGIDSKKRFSAIKARKRGAEKGKFRLFIPPSHEDFVGLLYNFMGKGEEGNAHRDFFETTLVKPLNRSYRELNTAKQSIANDFKSLNKQFSDIKNILNEKINGDFTVQDAIRVYLWDKHGHKIPGLSPTDQTSLVEWVKADSKSQAYAETLSIISKQDTYVKPTEGWEAGDIRTDLDDATGRVGRQQFFTEFNENSEIIFSKENLNKIEAAYGEDVVSAIKDILYRTKTGRNRPSGQNELTNRFMNYLNGSVAATMFFNIRSSVLQQMSMVNFINYADNNVFAAAKAFANQKQYYKDWATIFNSDFMKERRGGIKTDVNGAELAASLRGSKNTPRALLAKLLELGFLPTQIGDNVAIATGGSTFYRNRINTYQKQGLNQKEAEAKAWTDFEALAEATQQSARPDMVSQQQASPLGKIILAFQNVTSQFNRLGKKAFLDIKNRRITPGNTTQLQSDVSNVSRIGYYFAIQNLVFYALQTALFSAMFSDSKDDERMLKKKERIINGTMDSILRGSGVWGAVVATIKNMAIAYHQQREKDWNGDEASVLVEMLNVSPPLGIKARKIVNAERTLNYNKSVIEEMETFDIDNPQWSAYTSYTEAITNIPLNRLYNKTQNVRQSLNNQNTAMERVLMFSGWSQWNLGIGDSEKIIEVKETVKEKKKIISKEKAEIKKQQKLDEEQKIIDEQIEKEKKLQKQGKLKDPKCSNVSSKGARCNISVTNAGDKCTIHESVKQNETGKKTQCKFMKQVTKKRTKRCGMMTSSKSGYCYYHD